MIDIIDFVNRLVNEARERDRLLLLPYTDEIHHTLHLTPQEMLTGCTRDLVVNTKIVCGVCRGSGAESNTVVHYDTCEKCNGSGDIIVEGVEEQETRDCDLCWGKGDAVSLTGRCGNCHCKKTVPNTKTLVVYIEPHSRYGHTICYVSEGNQEPNKRRGAVIVTLRNEANDDDGFFE